MSTEIFIGRVKWFNNKTGYGFITVTDGKRSGNDIFVHHSAINVEGQYKYLVQGEYVEFTIVDTPSGKHDCQAGSVNGIKGGKLMCTTRHETNIARSNYRKENKSATANAATNTTDDTADKKSFARSVAPKREATAETNAATTTDATPKPKQAKPKQAKSKSTKTPVAEEQGEWVKVVPKGAKADAKPRKPRAKKQDEEAK